MDLSWAERTLLNIAGCALNGGALVWEAPAEGDWQALLQLVWEQKLGPLAADVLLRCPEARQAPELAPLSRLSKAQVLEQTRKELLYLSVLDRFRQAELEPLTVKGCLCRAVYPNGALRLSTDEDLYAPGDSFAAACRVLGELGWQAPPAGEGRGGFEESWRGPEGLLTLELHRHLFSPDDRLEGAFNRPFQRAEARARVYVLPEGGAVRGLSPHDHLLYLLLHALKHFARSGFGLRQVCDVGLWARRYGGEVDWPLLLEQTKALRADRFAGAVFALAREALGVPLDLPPCWTEGAPDWEPLLRDLLDGGIYGSATPARQHTARVVHRAAARQDGGSAAGLKGFLTAAFPSRGSLLRDYPELEAHPARLPAVWARRLIRYARRTDTDTAATLRLSRQRLELLKQYNIL